MRWLTNNFGLKLLALIMASALSAYVYYEINYPVPDTLYLSLDPVGLDSSLVLATKLPERVAVSVRGPYRAIRLIRSRDLHATVDFSTVRQPATTRLPVNVPHLGDVVATHIEPSDVAVQVDLGKSAKLPVEVDHLGQLDKDYAIADEQWAPRTVEVHGPDKLLDNIASVQIEPDLSRIGRDQDKDTTARLKVVLYDNDHERIDDSALVVVPPDVEYSLSVIPAASIRVLKVIPDYIGQPPGEYLLASLTAKPQNVAVPATLVHGSDFAVRTEPIDLGGKTQSFVARPNLIYPFELPAGSHLPKQADVTVEIISLAAQGAQAMRVAVQIKGKAPGREYVVTPPQLKVMSERLGLLSEADRQQVAAVLDVTGMAPGDYRLVPQLRLPDSLDDARISPSWITLTIIAKGR